MGLSKEDAVKLVEQLQHAHRISVAFYKRILPTLDNIASDLNCQFRYWEPLHRSMPGRGTTQPSTKWAWDYVPLFAFNQVYWRTEGVEAQPSDVGLSLCIYVDDGFAPENRKKNGVVGQPDAVTLPIGTGVLQAYVFRPIEASTRPFSELWNEAEDPTGDSGHIETVGEHMQAIWFEWPLCSCRYEADSRDAQELRWLKPKTRDCGSTRSCQSLGVSVRSRVGRISPAVFPVT